MQEKHVIVGGGNLGLDLYKEALTRGLSAKLFSARNGFKYPTSINPIIDEGPAHVWLPVGAGSVEGAKKDFKSYADLHIRLVMEVAQASDFYYLHVFSSNYVADPKKSLYAYSKYAMEEFLNILGRPRTNIYRVQSLYGDHKPAHCFPYKLKKNNPTPKEITLPSNTVTPTPTSWLAQVLFDNLNTLKDIPSVYNVMPEGSCSVMEWAKLILGDNYTFATKGYTDDRPRATITGCDIPGAINKHWKVLWDEKNPPVQTKRIVYGDTTIPERISELNKTGKEAYGS